MQFFCTFSGDDALLFWDICTDIWKEPQERFLEEMYGDVDIQKNNIWWGELRWMIDFMTNRIWINEIRRNLFDM